MLTNRMAQNPDNPSDDMSNSTSHPTPSSIPVSAIAQAPRQTLERKMYTVTTSFIKDYFIPRILTLQTECQLNIDNSQGDKKNEYYAEQSALNDLQNKCIQLVEKKNSSKEQKDNK